MDTIDVCNWLDSKGFYNLSWWIFTVRYWFQWVGSMRNHRNNDPFPFRDCDYSFVASIADLEDSMWCEDPNPEKLEFLKSYFKRARIETELLDRQFKMENEDE